MKKIFLAMLIALIAILCFAVPALAAGPSTVTVNWDGSGSVNGNVDTGDTTTNFSVDANYAYGQFTATDSNNNPYSYGVDTNSAYVYGYFNGGGEMSFETVRNTSYTPMYGSAGQDVSAYVGSSDSGSMATGSWTNYAEMTNATYGKTLVNSHNFTASASGESGSYTISETISSENAIAGFVAGGSGTSSAQIDCMTTGAYGSDAVNLGWGGGCYTNADATFTGAGTFMVGAYGSNSITTPIANASGSLVSGGWTINGDGTPGSASLSIIANFVNGGSVGNYSVSVR